MKQLFEIAFINQSSGLLFKGLAESLSKVWFPSVLYTGSESGQQNNSKNENLVVKEYNAYNRKNIISRVSSGLIFSFKIIYKLIKNRHRLVIFVSNPPFVPFVGLLLKKIINQKYIIIVYDIYPDILLSAKGLSEKNIIVKLWRIMNKALYENSVGIITIGDYMARELEKSFSPNATKAREVISIHNCADPQKFKPVPKKINSFAIKYKQLDKLTVMYSGNFGYSHSFTSVVNAAKKLIDYKLINILLIGEGIQKKKIILDVKEESLDNVLCLPYQENSIFPNALAAADIALVTMANGSEKLMVPSKIYYSMAVGSALIGITRRNSELAKIIKEYDCGIVVQPEDSEQLANAILTFNNNNHFLNKCKNNAHNAFINNFTNDITYSEYNKVLIDLIYD